VEHCDSSRRAKIATASRADGDVLGLHGLRAENDRSRRRRGVMEGFGTCNGQSFPRQRRMFCGRRDITEIARWLLLSFFLIARGIYFLLQKTLVMWDSLMQSWQFECHQSAVQLHHSATGHACSLRSVCYWFRTTAVVTIFFRRIFVVQSQCAKHPGSSRARFQRRVAGGDVLVFLFFDVVFVAFVAVIR